MHETHPKPWHRGSVYRADNARPMSDEARRVWRCRVHIYFRAGKLTRAHRDVALIMPRFMGVGGEVVPSQATIATHAGCDERTVRRALASLRALGFLSWQCRIVRKGWRAEQTSNSYALHIPAEQPPFVQPSKSLKSILSSCTASLSGGAARARESLHQAAEARRRVADHGRLEAALASLGSAMREASAG